MPEWLKWLSCFRSGSSSASQSELGPDTPWDTAVPAANSDRDFPCNQRAGRPVDLIVRAMVLLTDYSEADSWVLVKLDQG